MHALPDPSKHKAAEPSSRPDPPESAKEEHPAVVLAFWTIFGFGGILFAAYLLVNFTTSMQARSEMARAKTELLDETAKIVRERAMQSVQAQAAGVPAPALTGTCSEQQVRLAGSVVRQTTVRFPVTAEFPASVKARYPDGVPKETQYRWSGDTLESRVRAVGHDLPDHWTEWEGLAVFPGSATDTYRGGYRALR